MQTDQTITASKEKRPIPETEQRIQQESAPPQPPQESGVAQLPGPEQGATTPSSTQIYESSPRVEDSYETALQNAIEQVIAKRSFFEVLINYKKNAQTSGSIRGELDQQFNLFMDSSKQIVLQVVALFQHGHDTASFAKRIGPIILGWLSTLPPVPGLDRLTQEWIQQESFNLANDINKELQSLAH